MIDTLVVEGTIDVDGLYDECVIIVRPTKENAEKNDERSSSDDTSSNAEQ